MEEETHIELCYTPREVSFLFFCLFCIFNSNSLCGPIGLYSPFYSYHSSLFCSLIFQEMFWSSPQTHIFYK